MELTTLEPIIASVAQLTLASVLAAAAATKISAPASWNAALNGYRIKALATPVVAWATPLIEAAVATSLVLGVEPAASATTMVLFVVFALVLTIAMMRGADADCGCLGELLTTRIGPEAVARVAALAAVAGLMLGLVVEEPAPPSQPLILARAATVTLAVVAFMIYGRIRAQRVTNSTPSR
jgi:hypothetical protein